MFNQYEPTVKTTIGFLKLLKIKVNDSTVNETLQNHPDWPSFLCISDSLTKWNIPNAAGKTEASNIHELPLPFIAYMNDKEYPLSIVTAIYENTVDVIYKNENKIISLSTEEFIKKWNGIYLVAEPNEHSGEIAYKKNKQQNTVGYLVPAASLVLITMLSFLFLNQSAIVSFSNAGIYIQYLISLTGIFITSLLLWYEIDSNNPLLQKVCTGIVKGNCNAILSGKQAKLFSWLSWSEVGFFYFTGALLTLSFAFQSINTSYTIVSWLNLLALPYTCFSIYYQWKVAKQWCVLCLAVQCLLVLGSINVLINSNLLTRSLSFSGIIKTSLVYLLPVTIWYAIKPYILRLQEAKNTKREYLRIKFNPEIFEGLLKKQKQINFSVDGLGIDLGDPAAANELIKVCNPYCGPCSDAHPKIEKLLEENPNLKVKIVFTTPNQPEERGYKPVNHLLAIAANNNDEKIIRKSLDDWYLAKTKDYDQLAMKYPMNGELVQQGHKMEAMSLWCKKMEIYATPTIFINGYQLPDAYNISDLEYFLLE